MRLGSLCTYVVENLEFLDTPVHIHACAQIQEYNDVIYCECTSNYGFTHPYKHCTKCHSCEIFQ